MCATFQNTESDVTIYNQAKVNESQLDDGPGDSLQDLKTSTELQQMNGVCFATGDRNKCDFS